MLKKLLRSKEITLYSVRNAVIQIRASKGYVIMSGYENYLSAGSYFKNPRVNKEIFEMVKTKIEGDGWFWKESENKIKLSAAKLLAGSGFDRGYTRGQVGISPKHSLKLINLGSAKAIEIFELAKDIQQAVRDKYNVELEPEVQLVGKFN